MRWFGLSTMSALASTSCNSIRMEAKPCRRSRSPSAAGALWARRAAACLCPPQVRPKSNQKSGSPCAACLAEVNFGAKPWLRPKVKGRMHMNTKAACHAVLPWSFPDLFRFRIFWSTDGSSSGTVSPFSWFHSGSPFQSSWLFRRSCCMAFFALLHSAKIFS